MLIRARAAALLKHRGHDVSNLIAAAHEPVSISPRPSVPRSTAQVRYRCGYCLTQQAIVGMPMELEHLIPEALGGRTVEEQPLARLLAVQRRQELPDRGPRPRLRRGRPPVQSA